MHRRFAVAPYAQPYNWPKYHAQICHALQYAKLHKKKLYWCIAQDWPDTSEEESLTPEALASRREHWLHYHDRYTGGVMGILPLVIDMPMRFTETESRDAGAFKRTRCVLKEIVVDPEEQERIEACDDAEIALCHQPKYLCVEMETKTGET